MKPWRQADKQVELGINKVKGHDEGRYRQCLHLILYMYVCIDLSSDDKWSIEYPWECVVATLEY